MDNRILSAAEVIAGPEAELFLQFMSLAYHGQARRDANGSAARGLEIADRIGMVQQDGMGIRLTTPGFLVGNVSKEYCHYVKVGRTTAPPKPPTEMFAGKDVLDVGCSFGRTLWEFQRSARTAAGIELQEEYIVLGRALSAHEKVNAPKIISARAETIDEHFGPESLDLVFTRLVLSYCKIIPVLKKIITALRPGGMVWIHVDPPRVIFRHLLEKRGSWRGKGWAFLALMNLPTCALTNRQISVAARGRMHEVHQPAFLPLWWWRRTLLRYGLVDFQVYPAEGLVFSARK